MLPFIGPIISTVGAALAKKGVDKLTEKASDKVFGVPTPEPRSGSESGQDYKGFMDSAYPGTTPWERLGSSGGPAGAVGSAEIAAKKEAQMQNRELSNRTSLATASNRAHIISSLGAVSPMAAKSGLELLERGSGSAYDTATSQNRERLPHDIRRSKAEGSLSEAKYGRESLISTIAGGIRNFSSGTGRLAGAVAGKFDDKKSKVQSFMNRGKKPARFDYSY